MGLLRSLATFAALFAALLFWAEDADARLEGGMSLSRGGARSFASLPLLDAPAATVTAALDLSPSVASGYPEGSLGGLFSRPGLVSGFAAGFLGAGLLGVLFGHGVFGGLGGVASYLGLIFQFVLIVMLGRVIWIWWSGRNAPAFADLSPRQQAEAYLRSRNELLPGIYPAANPDDATGDGRASSSAPGLPETSAPGKFNE